MIEASNVHAGGQNRLVYASYAVAWSMITCFAIIFIHFLYWLLPTWDIRGMAFVCTLVVLEAFFSFQLVKRLPTAQKQLAFYRGTELVVLLVILKLFAELRAGPAGFWNNVSLWPVQFPLNIFNSRYIITLLPVVSSWWVGCLFAKDLSLMGEDSASFKVERFETIPVRTVILQRFLRLGVFVIILAAIPAQSVFHTSLPVASPGIPAVVTYFILGAILISLTSYISLKTKWQEDRLHIPAQIPRRWFAYTALVLAALVLLISWLPTNYGLGLLDTLKAIYHVIYQLSELLYELFLLVISLLASLSARNSTDAQKTIPQASHFPTYFPTINASNFNWSLVKSIFLWGSLIILAIMAFRQYIAYNRELAKDLRNLRFLRWLLGAWYRFTASLKKTSKSFGTFIQNGLRSLRNMVPASARVTEWDFINPHRLHPRQRIIFYYLALIRRAREAGLPRQDGQTPYEYARSLTSSLKDEKENVKVMTESFIEARYSRHEIPPKAARQAETIWESTRRVLRDVRKLNRQDKPEDN